MELASTTVTTSRHIRTVILKNYVMVKDYDNDTMLLWHNWLMMKKHQASFPTGTIVRYTHQCKHDKPWAGYERVYNKRSKSVESS